MRFLIDNSRAALAAMLRAGAVLLAALGVGLAQPAHAQGNVTLSSLLVQVWPEFDRPSALVILSGQAAEGVEMPVDLQFTLPETATLNAVAYQDATTGDLLLAESTQDGQTVTMTTPNGNFFVEFYDDALTFDGDTRSYTLNLQAPYDVESLMWQVQQPYNATDLVLNTDGDVTSDFDQFGLPLREAVVGSVEAGQDITVDFTYTKPDDTLSANEVMPLESSQTDTGADPPAAVPSQGPDTWLIVVLLLAGLALVGGGAYWYISQMRAPARSSARRGGAPRGGSRSPERKPRKSSRASQGQKFCTQCGGRVAADDVFCRHCGAKLK